MILSKLFIQILKYCSHLSLLNITLWQILKYIETFVVFRESLFCKVHFWNISHLKFTFCFAVEQPIPAVVSVPSTAVYRKLAQLLKVGLRITLFMFPLLLLLANDLLRSFFVNLFLNFYVVMDVPLMSNVTGDVNSFMCSALSQASNAKSTRVCAFCI